MAALASPTPTSLVPLCVDLDGTLIRTDLLWESLVRLLRRNPFYLFVAPFWWMKGRAWLKAQIAARVQVDPATLPYNQGLLEYLEAEKARGRTLLLVTASDTRMAQAVADHVKIFDEVLASDGQINLRGGNKAARLAERFGDKGFDYAGNSSVDIPVWERAREAIVVNGSKNLAGRAGQCTTVGRVFEPKPSLLKWSFTALRPHQWVKNFIIFVPLLTSHQLKLWPQALTAFVAFCLCASAVYILNDLCDLDADRHHPRKKLRPFASGMLPLPVGLILFPVLLGCGVAISALLSWGLTAVLCLYLVLTCGYSWNWKQLPLVDVFCLAGLYTLRLIAGHEATGIEYSFWLLVFSMFIFLSLALAKRFVELAAARRQNLDSLKGRGYTAHDLELVAILGPSSGFLSALVLALYVHSPEVLKPYHHPTVLLLVVPLLLYWISRVWLLAHRGQLHEDPIVFALKDPASYVVGGLTLAVLRLATGF
ncbi:MAG TPA: UbiA family prenyltransferase [Candidatus Dormibacteraeota bacterium]|nr:UbiA family prenyltransferase [Candidatus Dormibacteraeota bacterium]